MNSDFIDELFKNSKAVKPALPDKKLSETFIKELFDRLFNPSSSGSLKKENLLIEFDRLEKELQEILTSIFNSNQKAVEVSALFFDKLNTIYQALLKDAEAFVKFDPAAGSYEEVLLAYPGFFAISVYRFSNLLHRLGVPVLPRIWSEHAHSKTGIDIHPGANIGESFFIDHGTGVVIGESTIIGNHVVIYQGVTLGALHVSKELAQVKRHPTIEDHVIIYSGATILGGETVVGRNSIIGGNVWLTNSVLPGSLVYQKSEIIVRDKNPTEEPLNFVI